MKSRASPLFSGHSVALAKKKDDGILFALEAQALNLDGSELVVLSACDTARGSLDYSEGVYGLVLAFRTAGVRNVLVMIRTARPKSLACWWSKITGVDRARQILGRDSVASSSSVRIL